MFVISAAVLSMNLMVTGKELEHALKHVIHTHGV
jgi:hypothetical protein